MSDDMVKIPSGRTIEPVLSSTEIARLRKYAVKQLSEEWREVKRRYGVTTGTPELRTSDGVYWLYGILNVNVQDVLNLPQEDDEEKEKQEKQEKQEDNNNKSAAEQIILRLAEDYGVAVLVGSDAEAASKSAKKQYQNNGEIVHKSFPALLQALEASKACDGAFSVLLVGPKATGKTQAVKLAADRLKLDFRLQSTALESFELTGFIDANGTYHATQFVECFRNGGVMLLDELDAWAPSALIALNAPLSVGIMALPTGEVVPRHPDFVCVGAANTFGNGATAEYNAREKLDDATLSRFAVKIPWRRDYKMERLLSSNLDWCDECHAVSVVLKENGLPVSSDFRAIKAGEALLATGMEISKVRQATYLAGLSKEQVAVIQTAMENKAKGAQ